RREAHRIVVGAEHGVEPERGVAIVRDDPPGVVADPLHVAAEVEMAIAMRPTEADHDLAEVDRERQTARIRLHAAAEREAQRDAPEPGLAEAPETVPPQRVGAVRDEPPRGVPDERHAVASGREPGGVVAVAADRLAGPRDAEQPVSLDVVVEARVAHRNQVAPRIEGVCLAGRAVAPARDTRARAGSLRAERGGAEVVLLGRGHLEAAV